MRQGGGSLEREADVGKWLYFTARNVARTIIRAEARRRRHERSAPAFTASAPGEDAWDGVRPHLDAALDRLPAPQREAIVLHILCGRTLADAASSLRCPMRTLQTRVNRGLERLRRELSVVGAADARASALPLLLAHVRPPAPERGARGGVGRRPRLGISRRAGNQQGGPCPGHGRPGTPWRSWRRPCWAVGGVIALNAPGRGSGAGGGARAGAARGARVLGQHCPCTLSDRQYVQSRDRVIALVFLGGGADFLVAGDGLSLWPHGAGRSRIEFDSPSRVDSAAVTADGVTIATGHDDGSVRLWHADGRLIATLHGHDRAVWSLAFSPDGRERASSSDDATVRLWEVASARSLGVLRGHQDGAFAVSFGADGNTVLSGSNDSTVRAWDVRTLAQRWSSSYPGHVHRILRLPGRPVAVVAGHGGTLQCVDTLTGETRAIHATHLDIVTCMDCSPDHRLLAAGGEDGQLVVWDTGSWIELGRLRLPGAIEACAFAPDGGTILVGGWDAIVRVVSCDGIRTRPTR